MTKLKTILVTTAVSLAAFVGIAAAKNGGHGHGGRGAMMQKLDANRDGRIDDAERAKAKEARQVMRAKRLAQFDTNKNGALDPAEKQGMHDARATARFQKLDANRDGKITLDELKAAKHGRMSKRHGKQP